MSDNTFTLKVAPKSIVVLGVLQILSWGASFYLMSVLATPVMNELGWSHELVMGAVSFGLLVAGLASPYCGRLIAAGHGRDLIACSGLLMIMGLWLMAASHSPILFMLSWLIIGLGMAAGLYDSLFSTLGSVFGASARSAITGITLISGFCSAIIWPTLAASSSHFGWRMTCVIYGAIMLCTVPLYKRYLPSREAINAHQQIKDIHTQGSLDRSLYWMMAIIFSIAAALITAVSVGLIVLLQARDMSLSSAIAVSAIIGPAGVACRLVELILKNRHPMWTTLLATAMSATGLLCLAFWPGVTPVALALFGAGNGLRAIVKSALPMSFVSGGAYARISNQIARPMFIAQAVTPLVCGYLIARYGAEFTIQLLASLASIALVTAIFFVKRVHRLGLHKP